MKLNSLVPDKGSIRNTKRRGRGHGSGLGKSAGRGDKGAGQRSGFKRRSWFEGGQMPLSRRLPKRGFKNNFKIKIQSISFTTINNIIKKYNLDPSSIREDELFNKKIFKRSKGSLKLLNIGEPIKTTNLEISYASKKAVEVLEKLGGKIKLTKK